MKIDLSKLTNVTHKAGGAIEARCPACAEGGHDDQGNHLIIYPDGKFGCVANPKDKDHNKAIIRMVGVYSLPTIPRLEIKRLVIPEVKTIMVLSRPPLVPDPEQDDATEAENVTTAVPVESGDVEGDGPISLPKKPMFSRKR